MKYLRFRFDFYNFCNARLKKLCRREIIRENFQLSRVKQQLELRTFNYVYQTIDIKNGTFRNFVLFL